MLILSGFLVIGIQLLVITPASYSLVLLTANLEDIKKIARQFVPETVANQIARFLVQTSVNNTVNISEENNVNNDVNRISDEAWEVPRANKSSSEDVEKLLREAMERVKKMKDVVDNVTKGRPKKLPENDNKRYVQKDTNVKTSTTKTSDYYTYDFILTPEKTKKPKYEWKKGLNFDFFSTPNIFKQNELYNTFTRGALSDKEKNDNGLNKIDDLSSDHEMDRRSEKSFKRLEPKIQRLVKTDDAETARTKINHRREGATSAKTQADDNKNTTKSIIFDYYDNSIYIKKEILATSGPIELFTVRAIRQMSSSSDEYLLSNGIEDKKDIDVNIDLYFRKLLDAKLKQYKNNTKEIQTKNSTDNFKTSKTFDKNIKTTKENVASRKVTVINNRRMGEETTVDDLSYVDESYDLYY